MTTKKLPLSLLPLPPVSRQLTHNLNPDPIAENPSEFLKLLQNTPSLQRRARLIDKGAHFSYVTPLPLPFPFQIEFPEELEDKREFIEGWLGFREATELVVPLDPLRANRLANLNELPNGISRDEVNATLEKYSSQARIQERELIGVARKCVEDCFPLLDIGDSLEYIGAPALTAEGDTSISDVKGNTRNSDRNINGDASTQGATKENEEGRLASESPAVVARQDLLDILSGHTVLASFPDISKSLQGSSVGYAPWSLRYSGHQFGQWAGQLGDGRAISICASPF